ncbi:MAG: hypothetical protein WCP89_00915 [archaeon]
MAQSKAHRNPIKRLEKAEIRAVYHVNHGNMTSLQYVCDRIHNFAIKGSQKGYSPKVKEKLSDWAEKYSPTGSARCELEGPIRNAQMVRQIAYRIAYEGTNRLMNLAERSAEGSTPVLHAQNILAELPEGQLKIVLERIIQFRKVTPQEMPYLAEIQAHLKPLSGIKKP